MSIEQLIVLALVIVLPLLEALARVRQTRASPSQNDAGGHAVAQPPPARPRSPLSNRTVTSRVMRAAQKVAMPATPLPPPLPPTGLGPRPVPGRPQSAARRCRGDDPGSTVTMTVEQISLRLASVGKERSLNDPSRPSDRERVVTALRELVEALDRRVPHVERLGETGIARDAAALRQEAAKRLARADVASARSRGARGRALCRRDDRRRRAAVREMKGVPAPASVVFVFPVRSVTMSSFTPFRTACHHPR